MKKKLARRLLQVRESGDAGRLRRRSRKREDARQRRQGRQTRQRRSQARIFTLIWFFLMKRTTNILFDRLIKTFQVTPSILNLWVKQIRLSDKTSKTKSMGEVNQETIQARTVVSLDPGKQRRRAHGAKRCHKYAVFRVGLAFPTSVNAIITHCYITHISFENIPSFQLTNINLTSGRIQL